MNLSHSNNNSMRRSPNLVEVTLHGMAFDCPAWALGTTRQIMGTTDRPTDRPTHRESRLVREQRRGVRRRVVGSWPRAGGRSSDAISRNLHIIRNEQGSISRIDRSCCRILPFLPKAFSRRGSDWLGNFCHCRQLAADQRSL